MAIFHFSIKIFSRGKGHSAVEKAAYRAGEKLQSDYNGRTYDYTRKGGIAHTEVLLSSSAPVRFSDRNALWNAVEQSERNGNAQIAREIEFSLPAELSTEQNINLAREYVQKNFVDKGMCADLCVHDKGDGNPHAHVMLTLRPFNEDGTWAAKSRKEYILGTDGERLRLPNGEYRGRKVYTVDWNEQTKAEEWRSAWADAANAALEQHGIAERIDHRSYERQGVDVVPSVHMGVAAMQMERKGIRTERGDINRAAEVTNSKLSQQRARIKKAKDWLYSVPIQNAPTTMDMMNRIADARNLTSQSKKIKSLQTQAQVLFFLQSNGIQDFGQLTAKTERMSERHYEVSNAIKEKTRRIGTLTTHLARYEVWKQTKAVYQKCAKLAPKKRDPYEKEHADELRRHRETTDYFKAVLNGRTEIPIKSWTAELEKLTAERYKLYDEYYQLDNELRSVETLKRGAEDIMRDEPTRVQQQRSQGFEL